MAPKSRISRRDLLKTAAVTGAAVATGQLPSPGPALAQAPQRPRSWHREADVVVIGSGAAGMPAAIVAREAGSSVIVVEAHNDIGATRSAAAPTFHSAAEPACRKVGRRRQP